MSQHVPQWRNLSIRPKMFGSIDASAFLPFLALLLHWSMSMVTFCAITSVAFAVMAYYDYTPTIVFRRFQRVMRGSRRVAVHRKTYRRRVRCGLDG